MLVRQPVFSAVSHSLVSLITSSATLLGTLCSHKSLWLGFSMGAGLLYGLLGTMAPLPSKTASPFFSVIPLKTYLHVSAMVVHKPERLPPGTPHLSSQQVSVLKAAYKIGRKLNMGQHLAAVAFQESGLGQHPVSPAHYGAGSVGYLALLEVLHAHPSLRSEFQGRNWATVLIRRPRLSLWVAGYYLQHCYRQAGDDWQAALDLYRYGYDRQGGYPAKIAYREQQLRPYFVRS